MKRFIYTAVVCLLALSGVGPASADNASLGYIDIATGEDIGPQDGTFDTLYRSLNLGTVVNNGWTSWRTAVEFDLSSIPAGAVVHQAEFTFRLSVFEGSRSVQVHGYPGDGMVQLEDFSQDGLLASSIFGIGGSQSWAVDATDFVADLVANGQPFAGFNVREEPPPSANFTVMRVQIGSTPLLYVDYSDPTIPAEIDIRPGSEVNPVNCANEQAMIPVAILSTDEFDVAVVDHRTVRMEGAGEAHIHPETGEAVRHEEDVDADGDLDLVLHFQFGDTSLNCGSTRATVTGMTTDGRSIEGSDGIMMISPNR